MKMAILTTQELLQHFGDESNHYLYSPQDDGTLIAWMNCPFLVDNEQGTCGEGICYDPRTREIALT